MDVVRLGPPAGESLYPSSRRKYDVVLSFIGEQGTAKVFTNKLYAALIQAGLNTFFKEEVAADAVETGGIPEFYGGIEESRASIIVFSDHFASASNSSSSESKWCSVMEELAKILECRRKIFGNLVLPVYYGVDPSQVHTSIREALYKYEGEEFKAGEEITEDESRIAIRGKRAIRWRKALEEIMALYPRRVLLNPADVLGVRQASEGVHHVPGVVEAKVENVKDVWGDFQAGSNARAVGSNKVNKLSSSESSVIREIIEVIQYNKLCLVYFMKESPRPEERKQDELWFCKEINLADSRLSELPENPYCPSLEKLFLQQNSNLAAIPFSFFKNMPALQVLDLSDTSIKFLPPSVSSLVRLRELFVRDCQLLMELPPEIGALSNLMVLDLEGTKLIYLPKEIVMLFKLVCLKVSLYRCSTKYRESRGIEAIIPRATLSKFYHLKELSIDVDPDCGWWDIEVEALIEELCNLRNLQTLKLYLPKVELLQPLLRVTHWTVAGWPLIFPTLSNFRLIVGPHEQRIVSCLPVDLQVEFEKLEKCLKYVNVEGSTDGIGQVLKFTSALFLERHWSIEKLSVFKIDEMDKLKFCLLVECNEMNAVVEGADFYDQQGDKRINRADGKPALRSLQYLGIHCMKNLECVWRGPAVSGCLSSLIILNLHTCPNLSTIFSPLLLCNLTNLKELTLEDCPKVKSVICVDSWSYEFLLPSLEKISLLDLPELVSIFSGARIAPKLERMLIYNCPNLKTLSPMETSSMKEIKGEREWWEGLKWQKSEQHSEQDDNYLLGIFVSLKSDGDLVEELAEAENLRLNTLRMFQTSTERPSTSGTSNTYSGTNSSFGNSQFFGDETYLSAEILPTPNLKMYSFADLKSATRNFNSDTVLGVGGFGTVYKGWVDEKNLAPVRFGTGMIVAIKKLNQESVQGFQEWQSEVNFLGRLSHPNLVKLLGYCSEDKDLLLVYEFMPKGSLENHLFSRSAAIEPLSWKIRLKIAKGAARGLAFLHCLDKKIIYRDFKASNILLDGNYNAKIADFGLAKLGPTGGESHVTTRITGTYGYAAPEYVATGHLYLKSDVYGFGVVLLEMLTGLRALDTKRPSGQHNLVEWAKPLLSQKKKLKTIMDIRIEGQYSSQAAVQATNLTLKCLESEPKKRPGMNEVVDVLEKIEAIGGKRK